VSPEAKHVSYASAPLSSAAGSPQLYQSYDATQNLASYNAGISPTGPPPVTGMQPGWPNAVEMLAEVGHRPIVTLEDQPERM